MKTQSQNPAFQQFAHLLPDSGLYPARFVQIFWNTDKEHRVKNLEVVFVPRGAGVIPALRDDATFWEKYGRYIDDWDCDLGNSVAGWLEPEGSTPATVWGRLMVRGFSNQDEMIDALEEFGHIEECDWARDMMQAFFQLREAQYGTA